MLPCRTLRTPLARALSCGRLQFPAGSSSSVTGGPGEVPLQGASAMLSCTDVSGVPFGSISLFSCTLESLLGSVRDGVDHSF